MRIDLSQMHWLEWVVWFIPVIVIGVALGGILKKHWAFTSSLFWRLSCFALPILPMCLGVATHGICELVGYHNGRTEGFHPDNFAFGCFLLATPVYIVIGLLFSIFARGVRIFASVLNICLGILWYVAAAHVRM
jgi:hypothetical protein